MRIVVGSFHVAWGTRRAISEFHYLMGRPGAPLSVPYEHVRYWSLANCLAHEEEERLWLSLELNDDRHLYWHCTTTV